MKIVDYETFNRMPSGTIFAPCSPCMLDEELSIKVDTGKEDNGRYYFNGVMPLSPWFDNPSFFGIGQKEKAKFEVYDGDSNDYLDCEMFLVFDEEDIDEMIAILKWAKNGCKENKP